MTLEYSVGPVAPVVEAPTSLAGNRVNHRSVRQAILPVGLLVVVSIAPFIGYNAHHTGGRLVLLGLGLLTAIAVATRQVRTVRFGLALTVMIAAFALPWEVSWWPLPGVIGLVVYYLSGRLERRDEPVRQVGKRSYLRRTDLVWVGCVVTVSVLALLAFHRLAAPRPFMGDDLLNGMPMWLMLAAGLAFVTMNAAVEELLFRGAILGHLRGVIAVGPAVALQGAAFGLLHLHGYPYGLVGVILAGAYGTMLALLRIRSGGLVAPWLAHVVADSVIYVFILQSAHPH